MCYVDVYMWLCMYVLVVGLNQIRTVFSTTWTPNVVDEPVIDRVSQYYCIT
jgi:hypothetical protein